MVGRTVTTPTRGAKGGVLGRPRHAMPTAGTALGALSPGNAGFASRQGGRVPVHVPGWLRKESAGERVARWDAEEASGEVGKWIRLYCLALTRPTVGETERLPLMLRLFRRRPPAPEVFWGVLERVWKFAVVAWHPKSYGVQAELLERMRAMHRPCPGRTLKLYRGSTADRVLGLSWTTRRRTAVTYARGHLTKFGTGVVTTARVPACAVFMDMRALFESEIVIDPDQIEVLATEAMPDFWRY